MRGSTYKRCPCPVRRDGRGHRLTCPKQHGSWTYHVDVPATDGRVRRQVTKGGFPTRRAAQLALAEALTDPRASVKSAQPARATGDYLDDWLAGMRLTLEVAAWTNYRSVVELYLRPRLGHHGLGALTPAILAELYAGLMRDGGKNGKPLSSTTVRLAHRVLRKALEDAVAAGHLSANPATHAKAPRPRRVEMATWTAAQAAGFLHVAANHRLYACWLLALTCGLRRGELAGLRWRDVDLERGVLRIVSQRTTDADWKIVTKEPKGTSRRTIDVGPLAVAALQAHWQQAQEERQQWGRAYSDVGLVFAREDGTGYHPSRLSDMFQQLAAEAGVPIIRLHDARHSCATLALDAGIHPKVVQQLLGHASWSTTMDLYSHRVERLQKEAASRIEATLFEPAQSGGDTSFPAASMIASLGTHPEG